SGGTVAANGGSGGAIVGGSGGSADDSDAGAGRAGGGGGSLGPLTTGDARTAAGYVNLAPPMGDPLDGKGMDLTPPAPTGWIWYEIAGAQCRDGSATGFYVHSGTANKLLIFLEGGGACSNNGFCNFNPPNVASSLAGDGQTVLGTALGTIPGRQQPGIYTQADHTGAPAGIFDFSNTDNPFKDWSEIYVPYCTGDVHFGTMKNGTVPGLTTPQQFVGYLNMKLFIGRIVPTYKSKVDQVILSGSSAGSFGAALNLSMVQDSFGDVPVDVIADSGAPFDDMHMPVCMQKRWRDSWGLNDALPPDCADCRNSDGGGLRNLADFLLKKHPMAHLGMISRMQDEVMRLFFSVGNNDCMNYDTADPIGITLGQVLDPTALFPAQTYTDGLNELRTTYTPTGRLSTFWIMGPNPTYHQHLFRQSFYDSMNGSSIAAWASGFITGKIEQVGPQ
ncbi:MAG TPA: pectin acetylesterase-family hydrolase, partial [Polyangiales bacterium]|nr:pectin acetylesterase-family hydrolase [Polyangiales bacterium]